ncbi:hypothetical protein [Methylobacterium radiodurans]|uniref:Uncharacterized protein n=1 Tax=Methylobacterium radiodurans TaxID=2202828 RepID=A0A2U8VPV1_9HYPH|nr:hypothetical protein [Methylobacterium radiodurans]AWN35729.1 hypothetical protein DK427_08215 [Methylobacterium radiodurans]
MRILRLLTGGCVVGLSALVVGFVSADRLSHMAPPPAVRATVPEPSATGSIAVPKPAEPAAAPKVAAPKVPSGFDTERLNALMRGDPILPAGRR